ncbi:MAG TPA: hypothetical protein VNH82_08060 [Candidatus Dormibacteraeota bacterium]|nr:hypothetical protein [Candidatus Dormibacteraeota bacterium]
MPLAENQPPRTHHHGGIIPVPDDLLAAPVGVALLDRLESAQRGMTHSGVLADSDPAAVEGATEKVELMPIGQLLHLALNAAASLAGPWNGDAPDSLALAYQLCEPRRPLAEAVWRRVAGALLGPVRADAQEHWRCELHPQLPIDPAVSDFSRVYGNGEFPRAGFWTVSAPPREIHHDLLNAWEMFCAPVSRWRMPVASSVKVWNIDHPADRVRLVETFPKMAAKPHAGWELPGPNQHRTEVERLASVPGQHALRTAVGRHVLPDWAAVAREYDGVHLSWAGFLTAEGFVSDLPDRGATMLRYWSSERTLWLREVLGRPEALEASPV